MQDMETLVYGEKMVEWSLAEHYVVVVFPEYPWNSADISRIGAGDACRGHARFLGMLLGLLKLDL